MGILKDAGDTIVKYGEIIVNKTEELAKIAKLNLDIKRIQIDQGIAEKELGKYVIASIEGGASSIDAADPKVRELMDRVSTFKNKSQEKKTEIDRIKAEAKAKTESVVVKKPEGGAQ
jgi:hypothetical protein